MNKTLKIILLSLCGLSVFITGCPQRNLSPVPPGTVTFNIAGEYTWIVPERVEFVDVYMESCSGGGGGGGGARDYTHSGSNNGGNGGNGGGGCYMWTRRIYVGDVFSVKVVCPSAGTGGQNSYHTGWWGGGGAGGGAGGAAVFGGIVLPGGTGGGGGCGGGNGADFGGDGGVTGDGLAGGCVGNTRIRNSPSPSGIGAAYNINVSAGKGGIGQSVSGSSGVSIFTDTTPVRGMCSSRNGGAGGSGEIFGYPFGEPWWPLPISGTPGGSGSGGDGLVMIIY